jgi:hypothetical protein
MHWMKYDYDHEWWIGKIWKEAVVACLGGITRISLDSIGNLTVYSCTTHSTQ